VSKYEPTYWYRKGKYQKESDMLQEMHVPMKGEALTKQGQLMLCVSNLYYQRYNNGFGNPIGHYTAYIRKYCKSKKLDIRIVKDMTMQEFDKAVDAVIEHLLITALEPLGVKDTVYK
jgi:hypothetical protein